MKRLKISLLFVLLIATSYKSNTIQEDTMEARKVIEFEITNNIEEEEKLYDSLYNVIIEEIKKHEGFRNKVYSCPAGYPTIGYGHLIKDREVFLHQITAEQADSILRCDFERAIIMATFHSPKFKYPQFRFQKLAMGHFIFCKGVGRYSRSNLIKKVNANLDIKSEIVKWGVLRVNGKVTHHPKMLKNRLFEYEIYNK